MGHALLVLKNNPAPNTADVRDAATLVVGLMSGMGVTMAVDELVKHIQAAINVHVGESTILDNKSDDHQAWLPARRGEIKWTFWNRYRWYLEHQRNIPSDVVDRMDEDHRQGPRAAGRPAPPGLLGPPRDGGWRRPVGQDLQLQRADLQGRRLLATPRSSSWPACTTTCAPQTQERIDTGLLGFDTEKNMSYDNAARWVGVGLLHQSEFQNLPIMALTTSKAQGDFRKNIAESLGITPSAERPSCSW